MSDPVWLEEFLAWKPNYPDPLIGGGILYPEGKMVVYARKDSLKSMSCMDLSLCLVYGYPWAGLPCSSGNRILYIQYEISDLLMHKRFVKMAASWENGKSTKPLPAHSLAVWNMPFIKLDTPVGKQLLQEKIKEIEPNIVIIDPLYKALAGNILDPNSVRDLVDSLDVLAATYKFAVVVIHHTKKGNVAGENPSMDPTDEMLGAAVFSWWADSIIRIKRKGGMGTQETLELIFEHTRHAEETIVKREVIFDKKTLLFRPSDETIAT